MSRNRRRLLVLFSFLLASSASAAERHVPAQFSTIQAAVAAAADGDVIVVAPGTYGETVNLRGKDIELRSSGGPKVTILDGALIPESQIRADSGETATIRGFTFRNGRGTYACACGGCTVAGGAIYINNSGLTVADSIFENNGSPDDVEGGGAIFACNSRLTISGSTFTGNGAAFGGAVSADLYDAGMLAISDTTFTGNEASHGGAIAVDGGRRGNAAFDRVTFRANEAGIGGALRLVLLNRSSATIARTVFDGNRASHGGGLLIDTNHDAVAWITDSHFRGGVATSGAGASLTAMGRSEIRVTRSEFERQEASFGGGLFAVASGALPAVTGGRIIVDGSRFYDNVAHWRPDTGIYNDLCFIDGRPPDGNNLYFGGGADLRTITGGVISVTNSVFAGNRGTRAGGAHASSCNGGTIDFVNCTMVDNEPAALHARLGRRDVAGEPASGVIRVANSIVRGDGAAKGLVIEQSDAAATASITFSNVEGANGGTGNIDLPVFFMNAAARDFRLAAGSPGIDAGDNGKLDATIVFDAAGRPRRLDDPATPDIGLGPAPVVDLGAFEFIPPSSRRRVVRH